jgi:hypothetical protein
MLALVCSKTLGGAKDVPQALKRGHVFNDLTARVEEAAEKVDFAAQPLKGCLISKDLRYR